MTRRALLLSAAAAVAQSRVSWLALDLLNRTELCRWPDAETPVAMGSLLKPFLALAFGATHPTFAIAHCTGISAGCWFAPGHGTQDISQALANSCNAYFLKLAADVNRAALDFTCLAYGLRTPDATLPAANLIGLGCAWRQSPIEVARAFASLAANASGPNVRPVLTGLKQCALTGTARAVGFDCYAKTGTAPCSHTPRGPGDGFAVVIYPCDQPRHVVLVQHHGTTGANAARDIKPLVAPMI